MWIKKSKDEIDAVVKNERRSIKSPLAISLFVLILNSIISKIGYEKYPNPILKPLPWSDFFYLSSQPFL